MSTKATSVDLLHPTVVRVFKNWQYICFFGVIATLVTLMFFSISYAKDSGLRQTITAANQNNPAPSTQPIQQPVPQPASTTVPTSSKISKIWMAKDTIYSNNQLGFSIDYSATMGISKVNNIKIEETKSGGAENEATNVIIWDVTDHSGEGGSAWVILGVSWVQDSRTLAEYEAGEQLNARAYPEENAEFSHTIVSGVPVLRIHGGAFCISSSYAFFRNGFRVSFGSVCSSVEKSEALLHSLKFF